MAIHGDTARLKLKVELADDPLGRGYAGMTDAQVLTDLTTANINQNVDSMTPEEVEANIVASEFNALSAENQNLIVSVLAWTSIDPLGLAAQIFINAFGGGSTTISNLQAARVNTVTRLQQLGIGVPTEHQIAVARS